MAAVPRSRRIPFRLSRHPRWFMPTRDDGLTLPDIRATWSPSQARQLEACARRWAWQYVVGRGGWPGGPRAANPSVAEAWRQGQRRPPLEAMRRAVVTLSRRLLQQADAGESASAAWIDRALWRELVREGRRTGSLAGAVDDPIPDRSALDDAPAWRRWLLHHAEAQRRLGALLEDEWYAGLLDLDRDATAYLLDRLEAVRHGGLRMFATPDLIEEREDQWRLVRIVPQAASAVPDARQQLELGAMLLWAAAEANLPLAPDRFVLVRVAWVDDRWVHWSEVGSTALARAARDLVGRDARALVEARAATGPFEDVRRLPPAAMAWRCSGCGYRSTCLGGASHAEVVAEHRDRETAAATAAQRWWSTHGSGALPAAAGTRARQLTLPIARG